MSFGFFFFFYFILQKFAEKFLNTMYYAGHFEQINTNSIYYPKSFRNLLLSQNTKYMYTVFKNKIS